MSTALALVTKIRTLNQHERWIIQAALELLAEAPRRLATKTSDDGPKMHPRHACEDCGFMFDKVPGAKDKARAGQPA